MDFEAVLERSKVATVHEAIEVGQLGPKSCG